MSVFRGVLRRLHKDERGMETMQAVIILGIAAIILAIAWNYKDKISKWVDEAMKSLGIE